MKLVCRKCGSEITEKDVDVASEMALCPICGNHWDCRDWIQNQFKGADKLKHPPIGATYKETSHGFEVVVSTRSWDWVFWIPFAVIASAIMSVFGFALFFAKPLPGTHFEPAARTAARLFLTPFIAGTLGVWFVVLMSLFGKVVFNLDGDTATIFRGIGFVGWQRRLSWAGVKRVRLGKSYAVNRTREQLVLEGDRTIDFARGVNHERLTFLMTALSTHRIGQIAP